MSSRAELPTLAQPTFEFRKYTPSTSCACAAVVKVCGVDEATLGLAASISVMATAATRPNRRTVDSYSTTAWHPVRRAITIFKPRLDASRAKRIVTL
jgi:hypothetical protein